MNYQFTSRHLTLNNLSMSNQGHMTFKRLYLLNGAYHIKFCMKHIYIVNHIWSSSLPHEILPWVELKGQINVIWCLLCGVS